MESKLWSVIEKKMDVETIKKFNQELRTKINDQLEVLREENADLSRVLMVGECKMWGKLIRGDYSWVKINSDKKNKLFRLIDIYEQFGSILEDVKELGRKVENVKKLKNLPVDSE